MSQLQGSVQTVSTETRGQYGDQSMQTEDYYVEDKWVQVPPEGFMDSGSMEPSLPWLISKEGKGMEVSHVFGKEPGLTSGWKQDSTETLNKFVKDATRVRLLFLFKKKELNFILFAG
jgi:hypothetical protein